MPIRLAIDGPVEQPNRIIKVDVIREADMPDFFLCLDEHGNQLTVHRRNLRELDWMKRNGK